MTSTSRITGYGVGAPKITLNPPPIISRRAPTVNDIRYPIGQEWVYQISATVASIYFLGSVAAGVATWVLSGGSSSDVNTLTGNTGGAISPTAGNINILGNDQIIFAGSGSTLTATQTAAGFPITPYVVGPVGSAGYQTIQSAVTAANTAGGGIVYVQPGTYTENLTLFTNVQIIGTLGFSDAGTGTTIIGVHVPPATGGFVFRNARLQSATHIFSSAVAGSAHLIVADCSVAVASGYLFNLLNWTGILEMWDINSSFGTIDGCVNNTGGSTVLMYNVDAGNGTGNSMIVSGPVFANGALISCPFAPTTGASFNFDACQFVEASILGGNSTGYFDACHFVTGAAASVTMSSSAAVAITNSTITSSNNPAIAGAGAGVLSLGGNVYTSNALKAGTLTIAYVSMDGVLSTTNTPGASPQIVNARTGVVAFTDVIANGAYGTLTMTNSTITAASTIIAMPSCTTGNSALSIVGTVPGSGTVAFRIFNGGAASTAANITVNFWVLN